MIKIVVDTIIFDFDGVIVDSGMDIANAINHSLKHFGRPEIESSQIISYVGNGVENLLRRCFKDIEEEVLQQVLPFYMDYYLRNSCIQTRLYPNVIETLEFFRHKKLGVVTNKPEDITRKILSELGIPNCFHKIVGPESVVNLKPDPEGILNILEAFGTRPERALMVGDTWTDIEAGKRAGTFTCAITTGLGDVPKLLDAKADMVIGSLLELTGLVI